MYTVEAATEQFQNNLIQQRICSQVTNFRFSHIQFASNSYNSSITFISDLQCDVEVATQR